MGQSVVYQIRLRGHLDRDWTDWFGGLSITLEEDGNTLLTGPVMDQSALHGLLKKVRDLGMPLLSVNQVEPVVSTALPCGDLAVQDGQRRQGSMELIDIIQKKDKKMNTNRKTAIVVGILYIIGTVAGILSVVFTLPILGDPGYLSKIAANENPIVIGCLLVLTMGFALAMVPVLLFPVLKRHNEALALGYVVFRGALETVAYIATVICWLFLIVVSREYAAAGASSLSYFQTLGAVLLKGNDSISNLLIIIFSLDALILYYLLYRSKLVPRWISVWGLIAILLHFSTAFLIMFHFIDAGMSPTLVIINFPILIQEMVMAVWLIVKGFDPAAIAALSAKVVVN